MNSNLLKIKWSWYVMGLYMPIASLVAQIDWKMIGNKGQHQYMCIVCSKFVLINSIKDYRCTKALHKDHSTPHMRMHTTKWISSHIPPLMRARANQLLVFTFRSKKKCCFLMFCFAWIDSLLSEIRSEIQDVHTSQTDYDKAPIMYVPKHINKPTLVYKDSHNISVTYSKNKLNYYWDLLLTF